MWLALWCADASTAQEQPIVDRVAFVGNTHFSDAALESRVQTTSNRLAFGIRGLAWWRWLYRVGERRTFGERLSRALMTSGEPPAYLDTSRVAADLELLRSYYAQEGFNEARISARIDTAESGKAVAVAFNISPGRASVFRSVQYVGLDSLDRALQEALLRGSLLTGTGLGATAIRYSEPLLVEERRRVLSTLRDAGHALVARDSITAFVTRSSTDSIDVAIHIRPGPQYAHGPIHIEVEGPEDVPLEGSHGESATDPRITYRMAPGTRVDPRFLDQALRMHPGMLYRQSDLQETKRRLDATGIFTFTSITAEAPQGTALPHRITVRARRKHQLGMQAFLLQSSGVLGGVGSEFGGGLGVSYDNVSLFGAGETMRISGTASIAADADSTVFSSSQGELSASVTLPRLVAPFGGLEDALDLYQARSQFTFSLLTARREDLRLLLRGRGALRVRLEMQHSPTVTSFVDLLDVTLSNPDTLSGFKHRFLDRILGADDSLLVSDPVQRAQVLEDYTQPQINNALRYTLRRERVNALRRDQGYSYEAAIEVGGNLPYIFDRYVFSPRRVEGSLPGLPFFRGSDASGRMNYRQYVRVVVDLKHYLRLGSSSVLGLKAVGGWAHPVGHADVIPFYRRFFSGGASSVRGWHLRQLGPGATSFAANAPTSADDANILGGDIKLEFSTELRQTALHNTLGAEWIVAAFFDAGNVWFGPRNPGFGNLQPGMPDGRFALNRLFQELGVGSGIGLRLSWAYLVARFDLAYRAFDPATPGAGWWPTGLREPAAYFRFGHAF